MKLSLHWNQGELETDLEAGGISAADVLQEIVVGCSDIQKQLLKSAIKDSRQKRASVFHQAEKENRVISKL